MNAQANVPSPPPSRSSWQNVAPALTLMLLAPVIAEVLSGATRLSFIVVLIPEILVWGGGALIIREVVRRWGGGWTSILLLGLALSVAEEFIIQQTSIAPLPWLGNTPTYGRIWGVNWVYFLFMLGYESVWVVVVPIQVTELIFPDRRGERWLKNRGMFFATAGFLFGSFMAWFTWTQQAVPHVYHLPKYQPPPQTLLCGAAAILLLIVAAYLCRGERGMRQPVAHEPLSPWLLCVGVMVLGFPWYLLMTLIFAPRPAIPVWAPMLIGTAWAIAAYLLIKRWVSAAGWGEIHRWALVTGAILVCMLAGFMGSSTWPRMDLIGKAVLNVLAVYCLIILANRIRHRNSLESTS
jgi:hypothetical protein